MRTFFAVALAVLIAGCQTPAPQPPSTTTPVAPSVQKAGEHLTLCGFTAQVQLAQPPAELPENFRRFYGVWLGTLQSAFGGACAAEVVTNISNDGTVDFLAYEGPGLSSPPYAEPRHGKISGDTLTYVGATGFPTTITLVDANHLHFFLHTPKGYEVFGDLERVSGGERAQAQ